jgi:hypothetical protein
MYLQVLDAARSLFLHRYVRISEATRQARAEEARQHMMEHCSIYAEQAEKVSAGCI